MAGNTYSTFGPAPQRDANGKTWDLWKDSADDSSGYVPMSLPGASAQDVSNARNMVQSAAPKLGQPVDPASLKGQGADAYRLLTETLHVNPGDITIYQDDGGRFSAVLSDAGFKTLTDSGEIQFHLGDAFEHYPYTNGARDRQEHDSLHGVWLDRNITDYVGGTGVYMEFHTDTDNPWEGHMWDHLVCAVFKSGC
jgi:hypothetical protein